QMQSSTLRTSLGPNSNRLFCNRIPSSHPYATETSAPARWHFRAVKLPKDPVLKTQEVKEAITKTSLRKKVSWIPPMSGINPAYDIALSFLRHDREKHVSTIRKI